MASFFQEVKLCIKDASTFKTFKDQFDAAADGVNSMFAVDSDDKENGEDRIFWFVLSVLKSIIDDF